MLLAVDTSTAQVGLAVFDGAQVLGEMTWRSKQHHTVELAPAVAELMRRSGLSMQAQGPLLIEWPERMERLIPRDRLWFNLEHVDQEERQMKISSHGKRYEELLEILRRATYGVD